MEVVHIEGTERASFEVSAKIHNTRYTHSHLGAATNEQQVLQMTSVVISEKQVGFYLCFNRFNLTYLNKNDEKSGGPNKITSHNNKSTVVAS